MSNKLHCIVVAEDEVLIRMMAASWLADAGFEVLEASDAEEALTILNLRAADVHLLFTDIQMPGTMDGLALAHHVHGAWPHIALILASGGVQPGSSELPRRSRFVSKPYDCNHIITHARELIKA